MLNLLLPIIAFLIAPTLPQDISFPSGVQDDPSQASELLQAQPGTSDSSFMSQPMTEYQPGGGAPGGGYGEGFGGLGSVSEGVVDLGLGVHRVARNQGGQWWVYSPASLSTALYMVLLGSNGKTYTELARLLGVNSISSSLKTHEDYTSTLRNLQYTGHEKNMIKLANGMFVQNDYSIRQDYSDIITSLYQSTIQSLDFRSNGALARDVINNWVSAKTQGKIPEILSETPAPETKIVLTSSLYFKGEWASPFPSELTQLKNFYPNGRSQPPKLKVPIMATQGTFRYYHDRSLNCEVVGIPYKGENIIFYLVLPQNSNKEKLKTLENQLTHFDLERLSENAVLTNDVIVAMPKMKLSSEYTLNSVLQELGVRALFDPKEADLSLLASNGNVPRPQVGPFEDEERLIFTRMKKLNTTAEERRRRNIDDSISREEFKEELKGEGLKQNDGRKIKEEFDSGWLLPDLQENINIPEEHADTKNSFPISWLRSRNKRQIKHAASSVGLLPSGRSDNSLEPTRHLRTLSNPGLYVNQVLHKVVVDINEKGTEAAATTAVSMSKTVTHTVKADVPFLFFIRHEPTKMVLFLGSVVTPLVGN